MSRARCALKTLALVGIDLSVTCLFLSWHGTTFSPRDNFVAQFSHTYSFFRSTMDFLILSIIRSILVVTGCIMVRFSPQLDQVAANYSTKNFLCFRRTLNWKYYSYCYSKLFFGFSCSRRRPSPPSTGFTTCLCVFAFSFVAFRLQSCWRSATIPIHP